MPLHVQKDLDEHTRFKRKFGLYAMGLTFLSEFQCATMYQTIEKKVLILQTKRRLKQIEKDAAKTKNDIIVGKKYVPLTRSLCLQLQSILLYLIIFHEICAIANFFFIKFLCLLFYATSSFVRNMNNDFKHVNDVDRVLRDKTREIELFAEKKVCMKHTYISVPQNH